MPKPKNEVETTNDMPVEDLDGYVSPALRRAEAGEQVVFPIEETEQTQEA